MDGIDRSPNAQTPISGICPIDGSPVAHHVRAWNGHHPDAPNAPTQPRSSSNGESKMAFALSRRQFLAGSSGVVAAAASRQVWGATPRPTLPIPTLLDGTKGDPLDLQIRRGAWSFMPGIQTPTLGINQNYLGPTIRTRRGTELNLSYRNTLDEGVSIHGHGLHVPGDVDGGPQLQFAPGEVWQPKLSIVQPAATCWYHSHTHGRTGYQTYHGLAGLMIIDDDDADTMDLPNTYGVDDLPVVIQDRTFDSDGRLVYSLTDAEEDGWYGDTVVINGAIKPIANVPAGKVRLRLLNGANARFYFVTFADNRTFHKIACDGGLLSAPVSMTSMEIAPGERCEIILDMADGNTAEMLMLFEDVIDVEDGDEEIDLSRLPAAVREGASLMLQVDTSLPAQTAPLPQNLTTIERPRDAEIAQTREFILTMDHSGGHGDHAGHAAMDMAINGAAMDMNVINERVQLGVWERWRIRSDDGAHPFHVHGCSFLIYEMEGAAPSEDQQGWKDVVILDDDAWSEIVVRFDHLATEQFPYMYHCHILEHEDRGMMGQFTVT